jgi:hypothetical protein
MVSLPSVGGRSELGRRGGGQADPPELVHKRRAGGAATTESLSIKKCSSSESIAMKISSDKSDFPPITSFNTIGDLREAVESLEAHSLFLKTNAAIYKMMLTKMRRYKVIVVLIVIFVLVTMISFYRNSQPISGVSSDGFNSYDQNAPLFEAIKSDNIHLVRTLLREGIDDNEGDVKKRITYYNTNAEDENGITPLIEATLLGNVQLVNLLLLHGARAQPLPPFRHTPLRAACLTGNVQLIKLLLEKGADPNAKSEGGRTPLMGACYLRPQYDEKPERIELSYRAISVMLADPRIDTSIVNDFGETALDLCRQREYSKSMKLLRDVGPTQTPRKKQIAMEKKKKKKDKMVRGKMLRRKKESLGTNNTRLSY